MGDKPCMGAACPEEEPEQADLLQHSTQDAWRRMRRGGGGGNSYDSYNSYGHTTAKSHHDYHSYHSYGHTTHTTTKSHDNYHGYHSYHSYSSYSYGPPPKKKLPNVLVIIIDDMGWNQVSYRANATGNDEVQTPHIDALASEGIILDRFYATPWCAPSRGALQTGRLDALNPHVSNNVWNWDPNASYIDQNGDPQTMPFVGGVQPGTLTIGERMKELGYDSHLNGKWGIGGGAFLNTPMGMGYSSFMGWFGDSMESCDGTEPGFAVGGAGPLLDNLPGFWRQDSTESFNSSWCPLLRASDKLNEEEKFVGCKSFKQENYDIADEMIRRRSREIIAEHDYKKGDQPLFLVHALQLMHLPMEYPRRFAPRVRNYSQPQNEDLRAATYGALRYVDWVVGDLLDALKEQDQYDNTIVFLTSDNGGAIYSGTANNNYPLRGGKFNNFEGGQRVNALFGGGWVMRELKENKLRPFTSKTVMSIADLPETLLEMVTGRPYPDGGMGNTPGPLTGIPLWNTILEKKQVPRDITYSPVMQLEVRERLDRLFKIWFLDRSTIISDGNWTPDFPNNSQFIPDFGYLYVRPCGAAYCYFNLKRDPSEQDNLFLGPIEEEAMRRNVTGNWDNNVINSSRIQSLALRVGFPEQVSIWTHYGASGPFLNKDAEPIIPPFAQCWCNWIDDGVPPEGVTHVIFNLYLGARCVDELGARGVRGALPCKLPLKLTQAPIPYSFQEDMLDVVGFETQFFNKINAAQWDSGPVFAPLPLLTLEWNLPVIEGLRNMNKREGFSNWANIEKYPFNLEIHDHCPNFDIFTAPTPFTQVTDWILSAGIFNNPTAGAGNRSDGPVTGCFAIDPFQAVCPTLDNNPPTVDGFNLPRYTIPECQRYCVLLPAEP